MRYRFDLSVSEQDFFNVNLFHQTDSAYGKKNIKRTRHLYAAIGAILVAVAALVFDWSLPEIIVLALAFALFILLDKPITRIILKGKLKRLKKDGKLPFNTKLSFEFYEDKLVKTTDTGRVEEGYSALDSVYILKDKYILLYTSVSTVYILPAAQVREQADLEEFIAFISQKCSNIRYC